MKDLHEMGKIIQKYIRPATFPLAVRIVQDDPEPSSEFKRPPTPNFLCQNMTMSRRYGWTIRVLPEDCTCIPARAVLGWDPLEKIQADDLLDFAAGLYTRDKGSERAFAQTLQPLKGGSKGIILSPLEWTKVEPHVVLIYGNAAQMMRLVQSFLHDKGGALNFSAAGRVGSCHDGIVKSHENQEPRLVILGNGDRVWGMAQDDELLFSVPTPHLADLVKGLEATHRAGLRYPRPSYMNFTPGFQSEFKEKAMKRSGTTIVKD